jgi:hypothetical protein
MSSFPRDAGRKPLKITKVWFGRHLEREDGEVGVGQRSDFARWIERQRPVWHRRHGVLVNRAYPVLCGWRMKGSAWVRLFGYGVLVKDLRLHRPTFSERQGLAWWFRVGNYGVTFFGP